MHTHVKIGAIVGAVCLCFALSSCVVLVAGAAGAGTMAYVKGEYSETLDATPPRVVKAAEKALSDLSIHVLSSESTSVDGKIEARTALDRKIEITIEREDETHSTVGIRVDTFGDEQLSREILDKIKARL